MGKVDKFGSTVMFLDVDFSHQHWAPIRIANGETFESTLALQFHFLLHPHSASESAGTMVTNTGF